MISALAAGLVGCSPALDWREFVIEGTDLRVTFPCRPDRHSRPVQLAGESGRMEMLVCEADGSTYALSFVDVTRPAITAAALADLHAKALANLQATALQQAPIRVPGMTPNPAAHRLRLAGRRPGGAGVQMETAFFVRATRVYQASVIGSTVDPGAVAPFFDGLAFR